MRTVLTPSLALALLAASASCLVGASPEDLIRDHLQAIGGVEAHKKLTSRTLKGVLLMPEQGITADIFVQAKAPNKLRTELNIPSLGRIIEGFDGKIAWSDNPFTGRAEKPADQQAQARRQADFYRDVELLSRFASWTLKGKDTVRGRAAQVLEGRAKDGSTEILWLDESTHLLLQTTTRDAGVEATAQFSDHRDVDGVKIPFSVEVDAGPAGRFSLKVNEVKHGVAMDDNIFSLPAQ